MPERAAEHVEGCGFLVMGAEPGNLASVTAVDPAVFGQGTEPYLGSIGPAWSSQYVRDGTLTVLVITVKAPRHGQPIFALERPRRGVAAADRPRAAGRAGRRIRHAPVLAGPPDGVVGDRAAARALRRAIFSNAIC